MLTHFIEVILIVISLIKTLVQAHGSYVLTCALLRDDLYLGIDAVGFTVCVARFVSFPSPW